MTTTTVRNGIDVQQLLDTIEATRTDEAVGTFTPRARAPATIASARLSRAAPLTTSTCQGCALEFDGAAAASQAPR